MARNLTCLADIERCVSWLAAWTIHNANHVRPGDEVKVGGHHVRAVGEKPFHAAIEGTREIAFAVIAMTLTLAAVFAPLAFSTGRTGRLFIEFALSLAGAPELLDAATAHEGYVTGEVLARSIEIGGDTAEAAAPGTPEVTIDGLGLSISVVRVD